MKRYRTFMDGVRVSDTLHQRLRELKNPGKRPVPWAKYGTMAAALALVCGVTFMMVNPALAKTRQPASAPENVGPGEPDIATAEPVGSAEPAPHILAGSYEVTRDGVTTSYLLPYIIYGDTGGAETTLDWDVPPGAVKRELTGEDIAALLGGEDVLADHLAWDGYQLSGWAAWYGDGSFWGAYINGVLGYAGGAADQFEFAVTAGQLPPTCIAYPGSAEQNISGVIVTADKRDWETHIFDWPTYIHQRRVSFLTDGYGYRFEMSSGDPDLAEELVSRLVRQVIDSGVAPDRLSSEGAVLAHPWEGDPNTGVGEPNWNDGVPDQDTPAYDPREAADPPYNAPAGYTCPTCGETIPAGTAHDCAMCDSYPLPHICEICGEAYPEGAAHSHEACGYPLAPDTHVCEVCGQAVPVGMEHSHQEDHHREEHHSERH